MKSWPIGVALSLVLLNATSFGSPPETARTIAQCERLPVAFQRECFECVRNMGMKYEPAAPPGQRCLKDMPMRWQ